MRGSIKLFTWYGIPVHLHWSFGLIFVYVFWLGYKEGSTGVEIAWQMGLVAALFGCVLLHEYGHALTARRYGVGTRDIILTPIGGVARLERMPEKPIQEFVVAIAGPMVNVVIAALLSLACYVFFRDDLMALFSGEAVQAIVDEESGNIIDQEPIFSSLFVKSLFNLAFLNLGLAIFNLIPAFPMDGGRILRALLSMRIGRARATRVAAGVGQFLALGLAGWGIWSGDFMLAVLGLFVIYAARTENSMVQLETLLTRYKASDLVRHQFTRFQPNDWIQSAHDLLQHGLERHFLVFDFSSQPMGVLEEDVILSAIKKGERSMEIGQRLQPLHNVEIDDSLSAVHHLIRQRGVGIIGVIDNGHLIGVIDEMGLVNFLKTAE
jgi:Zn-dependent protease